MRDNQNKPKFSLSAIAAVLSVLTSIYTLYSIYGQQRLFQARVQVSLLGVKQSECSNVVNILIRNGSDRLIDGTVLRMTVLSLSQNKATTRSSKKTIAPGELQEFDLSLPSGSMPVGSRMELCVTTDGLLPLTRTVWSRRYEVRHFTPQPGGRPICTHSMTDVMSYSTLPPEIDAELKSGCVLPEMSTSSDYVPVQFSLKEFSRSDKWSLSFLDTCNNG